MSMQENEHDPSLIPRGMSAFLDALNQNPDQTTGLTEVEEVNLGFAFIIAFAEMIAHADADEPDPLDRQKSFVVTFMSEYTKRAKNPPFERGGLHLFASAMAEAASTMVAPEHEREERFLDETGVTGETETEVPMDKPIWYGNPFLQWNFEFVLTMQKLDIREGRLPWFDTKTRRAKPKLIIDTHTIDLAKVVAVDVLERSAILAFKAIDYGDVLISYRSPRNDDEILEYTLWNIRHPEHVKNIIFAAQRREEISRLPGIFRDAVD